MIRIFFFLLLCYCQTANTQVRRLGVLGSSTANGQGVPFDSSWLQLIGSHYRSAGIIDTFHKVAASTYDCYSGMPTGYQPPVGRNQPNLSYNITRLMTRTPLVSTVIINYPNTNFNIFSDAEILFCLDSIRRFANYMGARCYIATTQPRDNFDSSGRARLKYLNDVIKNYFGDSAIDFFTVLNNPVNNKLKAEFVLGDGVHINSRGHAALYRQVLEKNIFNIDTVSVERVLIDIGSVATATSQPDQFGRRWNNMTDSRKGLRVNNALTTKNNITTINLEVVNPTGSTAADNNGLGASGAVGKVYDYPASATSDHAFVSTSISNGRWRIYGLDSAKTYSMRFWGSQLLNGYRILQIKKVDEVIWQEYNAGMSKNYNTAASFAFSGKTEVSFDFHVKAGSVMGHINVIDILANHPARKQQNNLPPVANAGPDLTLLSTDSVKLNGSGSDPDGIIAEYRWLKINGPSEYTLNAVSDVEPIFRTHVPGTYSFELMVTDNGGLKGRDTISITVLPAPINKRPVASAGNDTLINSTIDSLILDGSNSNDNDGSITTYIWKKISGPPGSVLFFANSARAGVTGLVAGSYLFELMVTDDDDETHADSITIVVQLPPNQLPIANAGSDISVTLPTSVTLNGSGSDPDGTISSYLWKKISGPSAYSINSTAVKSPVLTNLAAGIYVFELTITDNDGGIDKDTVLVTTLNAVTDQRVLIDVGLGNLMTNSPDLWGKFWNNLTDARVGLRLNNAITTKNLPTKIKLDVINPTGSVSAYDLNTRTSNDVGVVGDYPASATNDNAVAHSGITNGLWKIYGLDTNLSYTIKFWGSMPLAGNRTIQIKRSDETVWKEYNSSLNYNVNTAAGFSFKGKSEILFNIRVKSGASYGYINVIDISVNGADTSSMLVNDSYPSFNLKQTIINQNYPGISKKIVLPGLNVTEVNAYPNPTANETELKISNNYRGTIEVMVYNIYGKTVNKFTGRKLLQTWKQRISFSNFAPGVYLVKTSMGNSNEIIRIIKN